MVRKLSKQAWKDYENNIAKDVKKNPKRVDAYVNSKMKVKPGVGDVCRDPDNPKLEVTANDKEKANTSKYFAGVQINQPSPQNTLELRKKISKYQWRKLR